MTVCIISQQEYREERPKYTNDDLRPELYGIYLLIISNKRNFYELQVM